METFTLNIYPIFKWGCILFAIVGAYSTINNFMHLLARFGKDKLDNKKDIHAKNCDTDIVQDLIQKFPLVSRDFMNKNTVEQNIENNQEIHEINIRLYDIEKSIEEIRRTQRGGL
jgi:hypothetical protein